MDLKAKAILLVVAAWAVLAPIHGLIYALLALVAIDFITGCWASLRAGEPITSRRMRETAGKSTVYMLALVASFAIDSILAGGVPVARLCAASLGLIEIKSVAENLKRITGVDILAAVIARLKPAPKG